jgi:hypothetical protein
MVPSARAEFLGRRTATGRVSAAGCERDVAPRQNQLTGAAETKSSQEEVVRVEDHLPLGRIHGVQQP